MEGGRVIHMAPPASRLPVLMQDLLGWLAVSDAHPLIASSVFHCEFEFILRMIREAVSTDQIALLIDAIGDGEAGQQ